MRHSTGIRRLLLGGLASLAIMSSQADRAQAAAVVLDGDGYAIGLTGVVDGGRVYEIDFVAGPYNTAFPAGGGFVDSFSVTFQILDALNALAPLPYLKSAPGAADARNLFLVPDADSAGSDALILASQIAASGSGDRWFFQDSWGISGTDPCPGNFCGGSAEPELFAVGSSFVSADVPLPAALPMLALGLGGLGLIARRRKTA